MDNNNYFAGQTQSEQVQRQLAVQQQQQRRRQQQQHQLGNLANLQVGGMVMDGPGVQDDPMSAISNSPMLDGESLDDIIQNNSNEMHRRWSMTQTYSPHDLDSGTRRLSMMEFGTNFDFSNMGNTFDTMGNSGMGGSMNVSVPPNSQYDQHSGMGMVNMVSAGGFSTLSPDMMGNMLSFSSLNMSSTTTGQDNMGLFSSTSLGDQYMGNTVSMEIMTADDFGMEMLTDTMSPPNRAPTSVMQQNDGDLDMANSGSQQQQQQQQPPMSVQASMPAEAPQATPRPASFKTPAPPRPPRPPAAPTFSARQDPPGLQSPAQPVGSGAAVAKSVYSKSGFDMVRALYYVASRQNPQIQLGAVDLSCAFVVTDISLNDCPIVYVSSNFQNLTGYSQHEILGKNCRFLQAPDGQVEAGVKREFVEDHAVFNLKKAIAERKEIQQSLINYRKGGKPFLNLLTMIPIPWETDELRYYVGFQIDVVECPDAITKHDLGGQLQVNYKNSDIGQYIWGGPGGAAAGVGASGTAAAAASGEQDSSQTLSADDVSTLLKQIKPKGVASDWHRQAWDKMLLENADDVVHVLTPKGAFQYLSPSCKKVLGYEATELVGPGSSKNTITSLCHPSDLISVTRELKDASPANPTVNMAFRIQQKKKGYAWFESYGSLFVEAGKGRKFIVLVGRKRPVFTLRKKDVEAHGGIGDSELWTKLSTSGMFLFVSSNIRSLLDLQPQDLVGTSMQDLMRKESRPEFGRTIEKARKGKMVSCKHEVQNRRGQVLQALTTLYPGDSADNPGGKASFLLAQTKLVKASSRSGGSGAPASSVSGSAAGKKTGSQNGSGATTAGASNQPAAASQPGSKQDGDGSTAAAATPASVGTGAAGAVTPTLDGSATATTMATMASDMPGTYKQLDDNMFEELNTTRCTSWQYELHQMEKVNRLLAEELGQLLSNRKKRKRRRSAGLVRDCANCHTRSTPEWRRGPSGQRDLCNSCGLRWAKQIGRVSPRTSSRGGANKEDAQSRKSNSPSHQSPLQREFSAESTAGKKGGQAPPSTAATPRATGTSSAPPTAEQSTAAAAAAAAGGGLDASPAGPSSLASQQMPPPQSNPLLAGGSGLGGGGMEMTSIREEREN
ncbi:hypothetical protein GGTG_05190 [Gaeumannomyces tritici R3-111a-1]|uniref:White collar 1 protein n=1 Tax=Gaeumannomyces tritici (strain R3-111a-1) TaxID=644352 RepID=J3NV77_GAET3|nr:hypothetical protein GGTG_05190 [Gaeumannomyces tritici R3-111a-1]EJT75253.1 hypothetical protein GGTG_05190 [Gaeumannomyces tritici R3-111a-1]